MKILLVEDDEKLGAVVVKVLKKQGYYVDWATDRDECEDYIDDCNSYDIVILDWMLPGKNGDEICQELREIGYNKGILFLTAKDSTSDMVRGLSLGADDYMIKPFENDELIYRIKAICHRKKD